MPPRPLPEPRPSGAVIGRSEPGGEGHGEGGRWSAGAIIGRGGGLRGCKDRRCCNTAGSTPFAAVGGLGGAEPASLPHASIACGGEGGGEGGRERGGENEGGEGGSESGGEGGAE